MEVDFKKSSDLLQKINNSIDFDYKLALKDINIHYSKSLRKQKLFGWRIQNYQKSFKRNS